MEMKLTKKKADELCYEMWNWLYHHPSKKKDYWPRWEKNGGDIPRMYAECPYCEFYGCQKCPLAKAMKMTCVPGIGFSWFQRHRKAKTPKTKKKYAKLIRDVAGKRLGK